MKTEKNNRRGYGIDVMQYKFVYLRRAHPADPVELCFGKGHGDCEVVRLSPEQLAGLAESSVALYFTTRVKA